MGRLFKPLFALEKGIEAADVVPDQDPRDLSTIIMSLSEEQFKTATQMFSLTPNLTANEVRNILLEQEREQAAVTHRPNARTEQSANQGQGDKLAGQGKERNMSCCGACGKFGHGEDRCWQLHPELTPAWFQRKPLKQNNAEAKCKGRGKKVKECQASS